MTSLGTPWIPRTASPARSVDSAPSPVGGGAELRPPPEQHCGESVGERTARLSQLRNCRPAGQRAQRSTAHHRTGPEKPNAGPSPNGARSEARGVPSQIPGRNGVVQSVLLRSDPKLPCGWWWRVNCGRRPSRSAIDTAPATVATMRRSERSRKPRADPPHGRKSRPATGLTRHAAGAKTRERPDPAQLRATAGPARPWAQAARPATGWTRHSGQQGPGLAAHSRQPRPETGLTRHTAQGHDGDWFDPAHNREP